MRFAYRHGRKTDGLHTGSGDGEYPTIHMGQLWFMVCMYVYVYVYVYVYEYVYVYVDVYVYVYVYVYVCVYIYIFHKAYLGDAVQVNVTMGF